MTNLFRGFDVCLLITAPMLLGFSPVWSLLLAAIVALVLLNSMDAETLRARQAEQQKRLAAERKQREAEATRGQATQALARSVQSGRYAVIHSSTWSARLRSRAASARSRELTTCRRPRGSVRS